MGYKNSGLTGSLPSLEGDTLTPPLDHHNGTPTLELYGLDHDSHASTTPDNNPGTIGYDYNNNELKTSGSQASNHTLNESDHNWHRSTNDDCLLTELDELIADSITAQSAMSLELDSLPENDVNKPSPKDVERSTLATSDNHPKAPLQQEQENKQPDLDIGIGRVASTSESLSVVLASSTTEVLEKVEVCNSRFLQHQFQGSTPQYRKIQIPTVITARAPLTNQVPITTPIPRETSPAMTKVQKLSTN